MIKQHPTKKFKSAESYAAFWNVPVPLVKRLTTCDDHLLHPFLSASGDISSKIAARERVLSFFSQRLVALAFDRRWQAVTDDFDASVNDYWQRQQSQAFQLVLMEEGGC